MDDLCAIFHRTLNQANAATVREYPDIDIYYINDYHAALVPIYLLSKVLPVCLSLHKFQGLWPLRTKEETKEVCRASNLYKEACTKYVQFGNTSNLLHAAAAASFISVHQKSIGVAGLSDKYGKRSWARYPALWTLKHVDPLPNFDPSEFAALDEHANNARDAMADQVADAERLEHKHQVQKWVNIKQDPNSDLYLFVDRWSKQKGVGLITDTMPSLLENNPSILLIGVVPVILYERFAAEKLTRLMYFDRVFSKPEFTALLPYMFSNGADLALLPSRGQPFGLWVVSVSFPVG
ncbi:glycosyltransferase family 5 protein [Peniophora sp. CONT]|nr:glycosyltransferase family 5 protein [Peniophora sp. CONT]